MLRPPEPKAPSIHFPDQPELVGLLKGLLGRGVALGRGDLADGTTYTAVYIDAGGTPKTAICFDLPMAASCGASLALIPSQQAESWIGDGVLTDSALENAHEVLNVMASCFNKDGGAHVKLRDVTPSSRELDGAGSAIVNSPSRYVTYSADIEGYPTGHLAVYLG